MEQLPEKWCIDMVNYDEGKVVAEFLSKHHWYLTKNVDVYQFNFTGRNFDFWTSSGKINNLEYTKISFEDFQTHILYQTPIKKQPEDLSYLIDLFKQQQIT